MVKTGQVWSGLVVTKDSTGALATPSVGPAGVLYVDGVSNGASVTISGANPYKWTVTLPALTAGQTVSMYITATIATIATASVVAEDVADTAYGSEALRPTTAGRTLDVSASGEAGLDFDNVKAATAPTTLTNVTVPVVTTLTNMPAAAPSAATIAAEILVTPANKLATGAAGVVTPSGGTINSVLGTVDANVIEIGGETDPVDNLALALETGGLVEKLNSMLEVAGLAYRFTAAALAKAPTEAGSGTGTYTDTIKDPSNNPLDGACVQLSTDAAGAHRVYEAFTNALGVFVMNPDPGTYYRWIDLAGYTDRLTQGAQVTVT